jgi:hypothetical protein
MDNDKTLGMKQDLNKIKVVLFDWISKALLALLLWLVNEIYQDVKFIMKTIPTHEIRLSNLESNRLIDRFKSIKVPMKEEELITYDTLTQKNN